MPSKLTEGLPANSDASKMGAGLSRGPNLRRKLVASAWSPTWPAPGATLDLDFVNNRGFVFGQGQGGVMDAITFTRASNGAWVGPDGLLKSSGPNLLSFSEQFDNAYWNKGGATVDGNLTSAPDETITADFLNENTTDPRHIAKVGGITTGGQRVLTIYAKAQNRSVITLCAGSGLSAASANFNLVGAGSVTQTYINGSGFSVDATSILNVGNGWYRCGITVTVGLASEFTIGTSNSTTGIASYGLVTYTGVPGSGLYIWGAQLELGSTATQYYPTNVNQPRFDWASTTTIPQKNLLFNSNTFSNTGWNKYLSDFQSGGTGIRTIIPNADGIASKIVESSLNELQVIRNTYGTSASIEFHTLTAEIKSAGRSQAIIGGIWASGTTGLSQASWIAIDLTSGSVVGSQAGAGNISASLISSTVLGDGYIRVSVLLRNITRIIGIIPTIGPAVGGTWSYQGNGSSGIYVRNAQLEVGSSFTSYVETGSTLPVNTPLVPTTTSNGILIEEQRTNLLLWSRDATQTPNRNLLKFSQTFTNAVWSGATGLTGSQQIATGTNPFNVCISPNGASVYVTNTNTNSNTISIYTRNTSTGVLTANGTIATGTGPVGINISADGTSVYVANSGSATISIYTRNTSTGVLTANGTIATGLNPQNIVISADGTSVYVANYNSNSISIYTRNTSTGALTANGADVSTGGSGTLDICISADGTSVYATHYFSNIISIYTRNTSTGVLTANGTIATGLNPYGICISPNGASVYVTNRNQTSISIYNRNTSGGALTANGTIATGSNPQGITISANGTSVYVANLNSNNVSIYTRNTSTGALTANGTIATGSSQHGIAISADGTSLYVPDYNSANMFMYLVVKGTATVVDNTFAAPDSTTTAATITATTAGAVVRQTIGTSIGPYTFSVYLYRKTGTGNIDISFDGNTFTTQPVTGAWTRYSISGSNVINPTFGVRLATADDAVYVWGAQLDFGSTASTYEVTTALSSIWSKQNITVALNQTGIDGVANSATSLTATAANATCIQTTTATSALKTVSVFLKAITVTGAIQVSIDGSTWSTVDLSNGLWNRIALTATIANPVLGILIQNSGDVVAMDYGQMEAASFATTPIFTSSATATRALDAAIIPNNITKNFFNWNNGTIFAKGAGVTINTAGNIVNIGDGTYYRAVALFFAGSNVVGLGRYSDSFIFPGAGTSHNYPLTLSVWNNFSLAGSWNMSRVSSSIFGSTPAFAHSVGYSPFNYGAYFFDISSAAGGSPGTNCKYFSRIILWPKSVSDSAVQLISGQTT